MKTLIEVAVNNHRHDAVIESWAKEDRIEKNGKSEIVWYDREAGVAKCHQKVRGVTIYIRDIDDPDKVTAVEILSNSIKELYNKILEIEQITSNEFID